MTLKQSENACLDYCLVAFSIEQRVEFGWVVDGNSYHPALAIRIAIDLFGRIIESFIELKNLAGDGHIEVADCLYSFDRTEHLALTNSLANSINIYEYYLAKF